MGSQIAYEAFYAYFTMVITCKSASQNITSYVICVLWGLGIRKVIFIAITIISKYIILLILTVRTRHLLSIFCFLWLLDLTCVILVWFLFLFFWLFLFFLEGVFLQTNLLAKMFMAKQMWKKLLFQYVSFYARLWARSKDATDDL